MRELIEAIRELTEVLREMVEESRRNREMAAQVQTQDPLRQVSEIMKTLRGGMR